MFVQKSGEEKWTWIWTLVKHVFVFIERSPVQIYSPLDVAKSSGLCHYIIDNIGIDRKFIDGTT